MKSLTVIRLHGTLHEAKYESKEVDVLKKNAKTALSQTSKRSVLFKFESLAFHRTTVAIAMFCLQLMHL